MVLNHTSSYCLVIVSSMWHTHTHTHTHCSEEEKEDMLQRIFGDYSVSEGEEGEPVKTAVKKEPKRRRRSSECELVPRKEAKTFTMDAKSSIITEEEEEDRDSSSQARTLNSPLLPSSIASSMLIASPVLLHPKIEIDKISQPSLHHSPIRSPRKAMFKPRLPGEEEELVDSFHRTPPDKEDLVLLRLALGRLREEGEELVEGVNWAYHPHDILFSSIVQYGC